MSRMTKKQQKTLFRILAGAVLFAAAVALSKTLPALAGWWALPVYLVPYLVVGWDVLLRAVRNIAHGQVFDENFLMAMATVGAFCASGNIPEAVVRHALLPGGRAVPVATRWAVPASPSPR